MSYQNSQKHIENYKRGCELGREVLKLKAQRRHEEYYKDPNLCSECKSPLIYEKKNYKFCGKSCAAKYNNRGTVKSEETRNKTSRKLKGRIKSHTKFDAVGNKIKNILSIKICYGNCGICNSLFCYRNKSPKKYCSSICRTKATHGNKSYPNGKKIITQYFNKWTNGIVTLDSSWEVQTATLLDLCNLRWHRPLPIEWSDSNDIRHLYFPDFYLDDLDLYLDPKNDYVMKLDEEKMKSVEKDINIVYGHKNKLFEYINKSMT